MLVKPLVHAFLVVSSAMFTIVLGLPVQLNPRRISPVWIPEFHRNQDEGNRNQRSPVEDGGAGLRFFRAWELDVCLVEGDEDICGLGGSVYPVKPLGMLERGVVVMFLYLHRNLDMYIRAATHRRLGSDSPNCPPRLRLSSIYVIGHSTQTR